MKKEIKKIICMILCFAMIFTTLQTTMFSASAKVVGPDNKTELTIKTDKSKYSWGDTIVFNIDVKNVSNETLTGIRISSLARNYMKLVEDGDAPVISKLEPGETTTVQVKYFATKLVGAMAFFFPIIWLFSPAARILYRETPFNYEKKVKVGAIKYRIGFEVEYNCDIPKNEYTVSFNTNGGSSISDINVAEGDKIEEPTEPTKNGFVFDGWYLSDTEETPFDFNLPIYQDTVLYAKWISEENFSGTRNVTFVLNDGSKEVYDFKTVPVNKKVVSPQEPKRDGYVFTGWFMEPAMLTKFSFSTRIKNDLVLYAGWESNSADGMVSSRSEGGGTIYSITNISIENLKASTTINTNEQSVLVLRFYDEETEALIGTISALTPEYCEIDTVDISINFALPAHFVVTADLYDFEGNQRCSTFKSIKYTSKYEDYLSKTVSDFEGRTVLNFDDSNINNFGVLNKDVICINQANEKNVLNVKTTAQDENEYTIYTFSNADSETNSLNQNDVVFARDKLNKGYLFKISEIEKSGNNVIIRPSQDNQLTDYYDYLKVDMHIVPEEKSAETNEYSETRATSSKKMEVIDVNDKPSATISPIKLDWNPKDWLTINLTAQGSVNVEIEMIYDVVLFGKDYFSCSIKTTTEFEVSGTVTATKDNDEKVKEEMKERFEKEFSLPKIGIPTPIAGLEITVKTGIPCEFKIEGSFSISFNSKTTSGFTYDTSSGRQPYDKKERTFEVKAEGKAELKFGPKLEIGVAFLHTVVEADVYAQAGVKATATLTIEIAEVTNAETRHACDACVSAEAKWFVEVGIKLKYDIVKDILSGEVFDVKLFDIEGQILFNNLQTVYFSIIHDADSIFGSRDPHFGFGECPNKQYRTTIKLLDDNGNEISGTKISVYKENGEKELEKSSTLVGYLYDGKYRAKTKIDGKEISKSFIVSGSAQEVQLRKTSADGSIAGKICSAGTDSPIEGATIVITKDRLVVGALKSSANGQYSISLPDGIYDVTISKTGYISFSQYVIVKDAKDTFVQTSLMIPENRNIMGGFSGRVVDAVTGRPVSNVTVKIYKGWDNQGYGEYVTTLTTNSNGEYKYDISSIFGVVIGLKMGNYSAVLTKSDYAVAYSNLLILPGIVNNHSDIPLSPTAAGNYRIILSWGNSPSDLDSHLVGTLSTGYTDHIYYGNKHGICGNLDRDDTDYEGPETITVTSFDSLEDGFTYIVHDYTNKGSTTSKILSNSGAVVKLYKGDTLLETYNVPTDKVGTAWRVFSVNSNGDIINLNQFYLESDSSEVN